MQKWLNEQINISYRELYEILTQHSNDYINYNGEVDIETLSFDKIMTIYKNYNDDRIPYDNLKKNINI